MLGGWCVGTPFFCKNKNGIFLNPIQLLIIQVLWLNIFFRCRWEIYRTLSVLTLHLFISPITLFLDRFCLHRLLRCYLCLLRNVLMPFLRLAFSWSFRNHFVVPISILYFSSVVFVVCRFFLTVSVGILPNIVLPRETILVVSGFPGVSNPVWL